MIEYKILHRPGASDIVIEKQLNMYAQLGFYLEFMDDGWFILSKWIPEEEEGGDDGEEVTRDDSGDHNYANGS